MNRIHVPNMQKIKRQSYELVDGMIKPTTNNGIIYNPWLCSSTILTLQVVPEISNITNTEDTSIHLEFASCKTPDDCMVWVKKYGLPYRSTGFEWWKSTNDNDEEIELNIGEFLIWAKIASWLLEFELCRQKKEKLPTTPPEVEKVKEMMGIYELQDLHTHRYLEQCYIDSYQILNEVVKCSGAQHFSYNLKTLEPQTGPSAHNLMQLVFLNIYAEITANHNKPRHCQCGKWFTVLKDNSRKYCSPQCQRYYIQRRYRKNEETCNNGSPLTSRKRGRPPKK
ncbi:hypothetical protein SPSIL_016970 [Sporomusa silvacetica DSM 10669]|uniref:CGNR zinc finger n=1 Tax=Sporomusa silvacetica DSM 10669 TaxID=1123289 RepID=A0ABZ3IIQ4_9FIRM|nr:hypothetical protein [Sporomusa silvacetica]OZC18350.1 hypothetical protein SPSIL_25500 [Sporomusa silvacetica DSM 10669]